MGGRVKFNYSFRSFGGCEEGAFFSLTPTVEIRERMRMHERAVEQIYKITSPLHAFIPCLPQPKYFRSFLYPFERWFFF